MGGGGGGGGGSYMYDVNVMAKLMVATGLPLRAVRRQCARGQWGRGSVWPGAVPACVCGGTGSNQPAANGQCLLHTPSGMHCVNSSHQPTAHGQCLLHTLWHALCTHLCK